MCGALNFWLSNNLGRNSVRTIEEMGGEAWLAAPECWRTLGRAIREQQQEVGTNSSLLLSPVDPRCAEPPGCFCPAPARIFREWLHRVWWGWGEQWWQTFCIPTQREMWELQVRVAGKGVHYLQHAPSCCCDSVAALQGIRKRLTLHWRPDWAPFPRSMVETEGEKGQTGSSSRKEGSTAITVLDWLRARARPRATPARDCRELLFSAGFGWGQRQRWANVPSCTCSLSRLHSLNWGGLWSMRLCVQGLGPGWGQARTILWLHCSPPSNPCLSPMGRCTREGGERAAYFAFDALCLLLTPTPRLNHGQAGKQPCGWDESWFGRREEKAAGAGGGGELEVSGQ